MDELDDLNAKFETAANAVSETLDKMADAIVEAGQAIVKAFQPLIDAIIDFAKPITERMRQRAEHLGLTTEAYSTWVETASVQQRAHEIAVIFGARPLDSPVSE